MHLPEFLKFCKVFGVPLPVSKCADVFKEVTSIQSKQKGNFSINYSSFSTAVIIAFDVATALQIDTLE
jgi:hypothetical protein